MQKLMTDDELSQSGNDALSLFIDGKITSATLKAEENKLNVRIRAIETEIIAINDAIALEKS